MERNINNDHHISSYDERLALAMEAAADGIWDWNLETNDTFFDHRYYSMAGYEPNEFPGTFEEWEKRIHPEDLPNIRETHKKCHQGETNIFRSDFRFKTKQGKWIWIRSRGKVFERNGNGKPIRMIGTHTDITELKNEEEKRSSSGEKYRLLIENAHDCIFVAQDGVIKYANPSTAEVTGYPIEELSNKSFIDIVHPDDRAMVMDHHQKRLSGQKTPNYYSFRAKNKSGDDLFLEINAVRIKWENRPAVICFIRNITDTKKLEQQVIQAQKMQAIGTLAGGIAHDFNNILGAILGYAQLAELDIPEENQAHSHIKQIIAAGSRAKGLVGQILAFSRQSEPEKIPADIGVIVKEVLKLLRASIPANIEIRHNIASNLGTVKADQTQIHQIMMNLCANSLHAMEINGGLLEVALDKKDINTDEAELYHDLELGRYLKLTVTDTGCGMDSATVARIFDPYFTTKEAGEGTGLGLATVHGIVKDHGGIIRVYSEPGSGSSFQIFFPCIEGVVNADATASEPLPTGREMILFVDDEKDLVEIGEHMLKRLGYRVDSRTCPYEALEVFKAKPGIYDMVITDMTMPGISGEHLAQEFLKIRPAIPIIICSGFSNITRSEKARTAGIKEFLMKPLTISDLSISIRNVLDQNLQGNK